tara:strand:- start:3022 stop:3717 length:696 start_codon:yes stop_codon:yes gene_type:complete
MNKKIHKNGPLVSVIVSIYNNEDTVQESIKSLINQSYKYIEILIMDDGSTDRSLDLLQELKDDRIKIFSNKENIGLTKSLNFLIGKSKGRYIARHDSDDVSHKDRIQHQINLMLNKNIKVSTCRAFINNSNKKIPGFSFYLPHKLSIKYKNPFIHGTLLIEKELLSNLGNYDERFYFAQDYKLFNDLIRGNFKIHSIKKPLYYLNTKNNISTIFKNEQKYFSDCVKKGVSP